MDQLQSDRNKAQEIFPDRIYRLGGMVDLGKRVSWAALSPGRSQPISCYLVRGDAGDVLIDTGVAAHRAQVIEQFTSLHVKPPLISFLTRAEFECIGNLAAIQEKIEIGEIAVGGMRNPFDAFDDVAKGLGGQRTTEIQRQKLSSVESGIAPLGSSEELKIISTRIRILATYWVYDSVSKTLFTSDFFGHTSTASANGGSVIDSLKQDATTFESARSHILTKYAWLALARTKPLSEWLEQLFSDVEVEIIAPTHGCVLKGKAVVTHHYNLVQQLLAELRQN